MTCQEVQVRQAVVALLTKPIPRQAAGFILCKQLSTSTRLRRVRTETASLIAQVHHQSKAHDRCVAQTATVKTGSLALGEIPSVPEADPLRLAE